MSPPPIQVKLLRVLQERELERLGSNKTRHIDVRVIAATNVDLRQALENGTFREDLYYRLNVLPLNIPPLRQRKEDIPFLAEYFVRKLSDELGRHSTLAQSAVDRLLEWEWPGNVRELENVIERSIVMCTSDELKSSDIRIDTTRQKAEQQVISGFLPPGMSLDQYEQSIIREALQRAAGNKSQAARLLGITRNALRYRLSQMGIEEGPGDEPASSQTANRSGK